MDTRQASWWWVESRAWPGVLLLETCLQSASECESAEEMFSTACLSPSSSPLPLSPTPHLPYAYSNT